MTIVAIVGRVSVLARVATGLGVVPHRCTASVLSNLLCRIDPFTVDVHRCRQVCCAPRWLAMFRAIPGHHVRAQDRVGTGLGGLERTVDGALEALAADFAFQRADAGFLIDLDGHRVLVIAEEASEDGGERVALASRGRATLVDAQTNGDGRDGVKPTLFLPWGWRELFLRFPMFPAVVN